MNIKYKSEKQLGYALNKMKDAGISPDELDSLIYNYMKWAEKLPTENPSKERRRRGKKKPWLGGYKRDYMLKKQGSC